MSAQADHLCVLVHGLWGNPNHLAYLSSALREAYPEDQLHILAAKSNSNSFTYDGIDLGAERVTHEIEDKIRELEKDGHQIKKLSITGYSLGGLVARYAIALLYSNGWFDRIQPVNFTTFATPHLGVRSPTVGAGSYVFNVLGARTLSESGRQMFLIDNFRQTSRPLLSVMADPNSIFIRALSQFEHRSLYANTINDRSVPFYTAGISKTDPYVDLDTIVLNSVEGTEGVILDPSEPVRPKPLAQLTLYERVSLASRSTLTGLPFYLLLTVFVPIGSLIFLANSGVQTIRSVQRVRLHESGQAGIGIDRYRMPLLIEEAKNMGDKMYSKLGASQGEDYLPTPPPEEDNTDSATVRAANNINISTRSGTGDGDRKMKGVDKFPTLALTEDQFEMIENLDAVGWTKWHVHIKNVRHTHAAIVVRIPSRTSFAEGKIVVKHWTDAFEI